MFEKLGKSLDELVQTVTGDLRMTRIDPTTEAVSVSYPDSPTVKLRLEMGIGKLNLKRGGEKLVDGTATYNIQEWKPEISAEGANVVIKQGRGFHVLGGWADAQNVWDFALGTVHPFELSVGKGVGESALALGGIPLSNISLETGTGATKISFDQPNSVNAENVVIKMGAGQTRVDGMLNTNARYIIAECGAGEIVLNFNGEELKRDTLVKVNVGTGQVKINVKKGVSARATVNKGIGESRARGVFTEKDYHVYETPNYALATPKLTFEIVTGVGSVVLYGEDGLEDIFA